MRDALRAVWMAGATLLAIAVVIVIAVMAVAAALVFAPFIGKPAYGRAAPAPPGVRLQLVDVEGRPLGISRTATSPTLPRSA